MNKHIQYSSLKVIWSHKKGWEKINESVIKCNQYFAKTLYSEIIEKIKQINTTEFFKNHSFIKMAFVKIYNESLW